MVIGETGSGKSTLLNAMVNYLCGIKLTDSFRYRLVDERAIQKEKKTQANSQTDDVKSYYINDHGKDIRMRVIDTPGFKDTRGIHRDSKIVEDIKVFFETQIETIDYICLVVPASTARLTGDQRYVFNKILEIFGADVLKRIVILFTFCDGGDPNSLQALKQDDVPVHKYFKFNNSALYSANTDVFTDMFWKMGYKSLADFFDFCRISEPLSLSQTVEVLQERSLLDIKATSLGTQLKIGLSELNNMRGILVQLEKINTTITESSSYEIEVTETYTVTERSGPNNTYCDMCKRICHENCGYGDGEDRKNCVVMDSAGFCTKCRHFWHGHNNYRKTIEVVKERKERRTLDKLKVIFNTAKHNLTEKEQLLDGVKTKMFLCLKQFIENVGDMAAILKRLNEIALKPNTYDCGQYIDMMIENEKQQKKPEWQNRLVMLEELKERMSLLKSIAEGTFDVRGVIDKYTSDISGLDFDAINSFQMAPESGKKSKCIIS